MLNEDRKRGFAIEKRRRAKGEEKKRVRPTISFKSLKRLFWVEIFS